MTATNIGTEELFREDAALLHCTATVLAVDELGVVLDRTVFYPLGGGQGADTGTLTAASGAVLEVADTRKHKALPGAIAHVPAAGADLSAFTRGTVVTARVNAARREAHRRFHTAEPLDKEVLSAGIARLVARAHAVTHRWISEAELDANPQLVRSMSVQPPRGLGRVRVLNIEGVDLQPCGGTHVANTAEVGAVIVTKIEKKSAMTRRVVLGFADNAAQRDQASPHGTGSAGP